MNKTIRSLGSLSFLFLVSLSAPIDCTLTSLGVTPLCDRGTAEYMPGHMGGLYPGGTSVRPAAHELAGLDIATNHVVPRDAAGDLDLANGLIGMISIGMSNTSQEFSIFVDDANAELAKSASVVVVNGAQGGQPASAWVDPSAMTWTVLADRITAANLDALQVQVAWIKQAEPGPGGLGAFPLHAQVLQANVESILQNLRAAYPNLAMCYLSSRTRAYTADPGTLNPEPFAFESAFSVRWIIEKQLAGDPTLDFDPAAGNVPWLSWGPYLWADGEVPRSDGFQWFCADTSGDFTHPSALGRQKVSDQLRAFFKTDPTATPWFIRTNTIGMPPTLAAIADVNTGQAPLTVQFGTTSSDADGTVIETVWTFDDGTFSYSANPSKTFPVAGVYEVPVRVTDNDGNTAADVVTITVSPGPPVIEPVQLTPVADSYVRSSLPNLNFGTLPHLALTAGAAEDALPYLRFDVSSLSGPCSSATLRVYLQNLNGPSIDLELHEVGDDSWAETGLTWLNRPSVGALLGSATPTSAGVTFSFDVTAFVNAEIAGDGDVSFAMLDSGGNMTVARFDSRESTNTPVLEVLCDGDPTVAYCFCDTGSPCTNPDPLAGCANTSGSGALLTGSGTTSVVADDLVLTASNVPANEFGIFFMGPSQIFALFGDGQRCVGAGALGTFRFPVQNAGPAGVLSASGIAGFSQANFAVNGHIDAGETWNFQAWHRDPLGPCASAFNLSNAVSVTFAP